MTNDQNQFGRRSAVPSSEKYEPRIASSKLNYIIAGVLGVVAAFAGLAGAGGSAGAGAFAMACFSVCLALLFWAAINNYVRKIELRLIDIQKAIESK
jgi:hypothetical protein